MEKLRLLLDNDRTLYREPTSYNDIVMHLDQCWSFIILRTVAVNRNDTKSITMRAPPYVHIVTRQQKDLWINVK